MDRIKLNSHVLHPQLKPTYNSKEAENLMNHKTRPLPPYSKHMRPGGEMGAENMGGDIRDRDLNVEVTGGS